MRKEFPRSVHIRIDIYNVRAKFRRRNLDGYTPTSTLIKLFDNNNIEYIKKIDPKDPEHLLGLIFTFPTYIEIAKIFLKVIIINNTYDINQFNHPFYQISNVSSISTISNYIFSVIDNKKEEAFHFLVEATYKLRSRYNLLIPSTIVINKYRKSNRYSV